MAGIAVDEGRPTLGFFHREVWKGRYRVDEEMMDEEELEPKKSAGLVPRVFDSLSIEELTEYIGELKAEILRAEAAIDKKKNVRDDAENFFRR